VSNCQPPVATRVRIEYSLATTESRLVCRVWENPEINTILKAVKGTVARNGSSPTRTFDED
jgi:hypothetical protein